MATRRPEFEAIFQETIVPELIAEVHKTGISDNAVEWIAKNLTHNTMGGKYNRGMTVPDTYRILLGKDKLSPEEFKQSAILGWCTELLQAMFLVADDIMDSSKTRRGSPCWYLMPDVGSIAINDSFILESAIYILLKKHFKGTSYYVDLFELFHEVTWQTELGQLVDLLTAPEDNIDLSRFNYQKYYFIVRYKTAFYSFYLPVALAMYQVGIATPENLSRARDVLIPLGEYFQVQDDYLDCYGDPEHIGKIGTDIQDNKCGWLINKALELVSPEQRRVLDENYGRKDAACEKVIKEIYLELGLEAHYQAYERKSIEMIKELISKVDESQGLKQDVLLGFLNKIAGRSK
ncbi:putative farnesyl-diphosphate synthetase [Morchella snyderi]|nr:putative farnesyl-diphosphate synthetase [Morchella snyderi]